MEAQNEQLSQRPTVADSKVQSEVPRWSELVRLLRGRDNGSRGDELGLR
jgi:hypothetical protein